MMKKKVFILFVVMLVMGIAGIVFLHWRSRRAEPKYLGKTAQFWLGQFYTTNQGTVMKAFRQMGTNAFPVLVGNLARNDSKLDEWNARVYPRLPKILKEGWPWPVLPMGRIGLWTAAESVLVNATPESRQVLPELVKILQNTNCGSRPFTLSLVSTLARSQDIECVPALIDGLKEKDADMRGEACDGLQNIGPAAKAAVPALMASLKDSDRDVRTRAAIALWKIDGQTNVAVATLREALNSVGPSTAKEFAPVYLRLINPHDESLIPVFIERLRYSGDNVRLAAVFALGTYGKAAMAAVPLLTNMVDSPDRELHERVLRALKAIDPATAAKYEAVGAH